MKYFGVICFAFHNFFTIQESCGFSFSNLVSRDSETFSQELGDECFSPIISQKGVCMHVSECSALTRANLKDLEICSFEQQQTIVCCPSVISKELRRPSAISKLIVRI